MLQRPTKVCGSDRPECPRCDGVIRRIHAGHGSTYARCESKPRPGSPTALRGDKHCGQHVHILGCPEGVCIVTPISREEFQHFTKASYTLARRLYGALGVLLATRDAGPDDTIPTHDCNTCHEPTRLFDLYAGTCRWCRDQLPRPAVA